MRSESGITTHLGRRDPHSSAVRTRRARGLLRTLDGLLQQGFAMISKPGMVTLVLLACPVSEAVRTTNLPISKSQGNGVYQESVNSLGARKVKLAPIGYVLLPQGFKAYCEIRLRDTWRGYIESPDRTFRIDFWGGMVQSPFENGESGFQWVKREKIGTGMLRYGIKHTPTGDVAVGSVTWLNFSTPIRREGDLDQFLQIVRSHRMEECEGCESPPPPPSNNSSDRSGTAANTPTTCCH
jgi:hypothetical protein